jgi:hypothetical protein
MLASRNSSMQRKILWISIAIIIILPNIFLEATLTQAIEAICSKTLYDNILQSLQNIKNQSTNNLAKLPRSHVTQILA